MSDDYLSTRRGAEALAYHLERFYGEKEPYCPQCRSEVRFDHARAAYRCDRCEIWISRRIIPMRPVDESVRRPEEVT